MKTPYNNLPWAARAIVLGLAAVAIVACEKRLDSAGKVVPGHQVASSSAVLIGTQPAPATTAADAPPETTPVPANQQLTSQPPLTETAQTSSPANASKEITKAEENSSTPLPGQANDHSNVASDPSQKAGQSDPQMKPDRAEDASPPQRQPPKQ
jgi:hypothetical protein